MIVTLRTLLKTDRANLQQLLSRIVEFDQEDEGLAMELIDVALEYPNQKDYSFIIAGDESSQIIGYACYGPTPITDRTFDLYWIAIDPQCAGKGIGTMILNAVEAKLREVNGRMLVIETSSDPKYNLTRQFYLKNGYDLAETLKDFFKEGEDRVTYTKRIAAGSE